ncbi:MAG: hypothetical protein KME46_33245 [Brasilonema angustatum HA4187-MV1]|jgi:hypothetical protein|nr:hypothetical protein [Brasilonema angustatum HA4187-MV1]
MSSSNLSLGNLSLKDLKNLQSNIPELAGFPSRVLVETYDEFIKELYETIDRIIFYKEENPELYKEDTEDRITIDIKNNLCLLGYNASHEMKIGGHADLVVKRNEFLWIGEAKIHSSYNYLWEGFLQLTTRYSTGDCNQKDGGLLIYIRNENAKNIMDTWKNHLSSKKLPNYSFNPCLKRKLAFFSNHTHERTGELFRVRHMGITLYFNPKDKSAIKRQIKNK